MQGPLLILHVFFVRCLGEETIVGGRVALGWSWVWWGATTLKKKQIHTSNEKGARRAFFLTTFAQTALRTKEFSISRYPIL